MNRTLNALRPGESAFVEAVSQEGERNMMARLMDIGLTGGARVACLFAAPSGEPRAYWIRGAVIALRRKDAEKVYLREEGATA